MSEDRRLVLLARVVLTPRELDVWLSKHVSGYGRRAGSLALGITEEAWRYRMAVATRKIDEARKEQVA